MKTRLLLAVLLLVACGREATTPTEPAPRPAADVVVFIVGNNGGASFNPNPAAGHTIAWQNADKETHRLVANDGSFDTGNIAPGSSTTVTITSSTVYHCTIHPTMVGSVISR